MANDSLEVYGRKVPAGSGSQSLPITLDDLQSVLVAQKLPAYTELTRRGTGWATMSTSAVAGLVVRPTTIAAFEIFNGYPGGGKSLVVDRLFWFNLVSTNVVEGFSGWAMVTTAKVTPASGSFAVTSAYGNKNYSGPVVAAASTTVVANGWYPWGNAYQKGAGGVVPFGALSEKVEGRLIVPPQCSLCLHVVASLVGDTFTQGASWYEEQITLE